MQSVAGTSASHPIHPPWMRQIVRLPSLALWERVAEDFAMVDILSEGRLTLGVGSGYLKHEFEGFGISGAEKRDRFDESLEILMKAWSGKRFSFKGKYHNIEDVKLNVVPVQQPHPRTHVAILSNAAATGIVYGDGQQTHDRS